MWKICRNLGKRLVLPTSPPPDFISLSSLRRRNNNNCRIAGCKKKLKGGVRVENLAKTWKTASFAYLPPTPVSFLFLPSIPETTTIAGCKKKKEGGGTCGKSSRNLGKRLVLPTSPPQFHFVWHLNAPKNEKEGGVSKKEIDPNFGTCKKKLKMKFLYLPPLNFIFKKMMFCVLTKQEIGIIAVLCFGCEKQQPKTQQVANS